MLEILIGKIRYEEIFSDNLAANGCPTFLESIIVILNNFINPPKKEKKTEKSKNDVIKYEIQ